MSIKRLGFVYKKTTEIPGKPDGERPKKKLKSNTGCKRININGTLGAEGRDVLIRMDESMNAQSTIRFLQEIESKYDKVGNIYLIADNVKYYRSRLVSQNLETSRIKIEFFPSYSPN